MGRAFENMEKICLCCCKEKKIVNSFFQMCRECNTARLKEEKQEKVSEPLFNKKVIEKGLFVTLTGTINKEKGLFEKPKVDKTKNAIEADEKFYEECFNNSDHRCEECGIDLPDTFRDDNGKVIARWRYSHIIPKSINPSLRHNINNINHLCLKHHQMWDFGNKKSMKIYVKNLVSFLQYLEL